MDIKIALQIMQKEVPARSEVPKKKAVDVVQKSKEMIDIIEGGQGHDCYEWNYLKSLFLALQDKKKLSEVEKDLLGLIEPVILKYVEFDSALAPKVEGYKLNRQFGDN